MNVLKNIPLTDISPNRTVAITEIFPEKNLKGKYCLSPFVSVEITSFGGVRMCMCMAWMPILIGNIFESPINHLLSGHLAQDIRNSIVDGTYHYCNEKICGILGNNYLIGYDNLPDQVKNLVDDPKKFIMPNEIFIAGDDVCNLSCPSCRSGIVKNSPTEKEQLENLGLTIKNNLFYTPTDRPITVTLSTSGELFASAILLKFLESINIEDFPNLYFQIQTNGLLAEKNWHRIQHLESRIKKITVSIDAASKDTYEKLRRGGLWNNLNSAMDFLKVKKSELKFQLITRMVVQLDNYKEMMEFHKFSKNYDANSIEYTKLTNWYWDSDKFLKHDVCNPDHPEHNYFLKILESVVTLPDIWISGIDTSSAFPNAS